MGKSKSSGNNGNGNSSENISSFQNLNKREQIERAKVFSEQYRVDDGSNFRLKIMILMPILIWVTKINHWFRIHYKWELKH